MRKALRNMTLTVAGALMLVPFAQGAVSTAQKKDGLTTTEKDVRHELVMLPWFSVFDNLEFQVNGNEVVLSGQVTRPTLKSDAERVLSRIEGITKVVKQHRSFAAFADLMIRSALQRIGRSMASVHCPATTGHPCGRSTSSSRTGT